jgi:glycosyltransferase involved in cell wall biosynthesis
VHNNSLHHLPVTMAPSLPVRVPVLLHTPPVPWLESALALATTNTAFTAVSSFTARSWSHLVTSTTVRRGVDLDERSSGPGGGSAVWSGRLVPEKAPHHAVDACRRAGLALVLGGDVHYAGHLHRTELAALVGEAAVAVVTPAWDEPYGLVASEAMACGTPVAGYTRGGLPEIVPESAGVLVASEDVPALAAAITTAAGLDRSAVRGHAEEACGLGRMVDDYEHCYQAVLDRGVAA